MTPHTKDLSDVSMAQIKMDDFRPISRNISEMV